MLGADVEKLKLRNKQVDAFTNKFLASLPFKVQSVADLGGLRQAWRERESVPCLFESRDAATDNSFLGLDIRTFLSGDNSSGRLSAHDIIVAPGSGLPRHYQTEGEFYLAVIEGEVELTVGKLTEASRAGSFAYIPPYTTAAIENKCNAPARLFLIGYPAGVDRAFSEARALWLKSGDKSAAPYLAILERFGFRFGASSPQKNDGRTNMKPVRLEADINSLDDFQSMRESWSKRQPIPKLIHSPERNRPDIASDGGAASSRAGMLCNGDETSGHAVMGIGETGPGYSAFSHYQPTEEELFYVLSGDFELTCGAQTRRLRPGAFGFAPRFATHGFVNPQTMDVARVITLNSPAGHERGFEMQRKLKIFAYADGPEHMSAHGWEIPEPA